MDSCTVGFSKQLYKSCSLPREHSPMSTMGCKSCEFMHLLSNSDFKEHNLQDSIQSWGREAGEI